MSPYRTPEPPETNCDCMRQFLLVLLGLFVAYGLLFLGLLLAVNL